MKKILITVSLIAVMSLLLALCVFADNKNEVTVTFDTDGGSEVKPVKVQSGSKLAEPKAPTKEYYDFAGWYVLMDEEAELEKAKAQAEENGVELTEDDIATLKSVDENDEEWSFIGYTVTENMTLVAKWVPNGEMPPMDFDFNGDNFVQSLGYMGKGMVGIFVVTLVIIGVVAILNWHGRSLERRNNNRKDNE